MSRDAPPLPRLVARIYRVAAVPFRQRLLAVLVQPVSTLGLMAVGAGVFAGAALRRAAGLEAISAEDAAQLSSEQVGELARFAFEVDPDTFQQVARLVAESRLSLMALSASALLLWWRRGERKK